jgi:hypothetical protein
MGVRHLASNLLATSEPSARGVLACAHLPIDGAEAARDRIGEHGRRQGEVPETIVSYVMR